MSFHRREEKNIAYIENQAVLKTLRAISGLQTSFLASLNSFTSRCQKGNQRKHENATEEEKYLQ